MKTNNEAISPVFYQLASAVDSRPSGKPGPNDIFYSQTDFNMPIPAGATSFILSANSDGTGQIYVDDLINIYINNSTTASYIWDFSNHNSGKITPLNPVDLSSIFLPLVGTSIVLQTTFTDLYPNAQGGSSFYLCIS